MNPQSPSRRRSADKEQLEVENLIRDLARFRYALRKFLRFSENAARQFGVTPQQHQLMLGVAGFTGRGSATVSELAEFLQERHHSVVGLVERAVQNGLVRRVQGTTDRRLVVVSLTRQGEDLLSKLAALHREEAKRVTGFLAISQIPPGSPGVKKTGRSKQLAEKL
jgi:DNA-binding MarR family transcriptional regulator